MAYTVIYIKDQKTGQHIPIRVTDNLDNTYSAENAYVLCILSLFNGEKYYV